MPEKTPMAVPGSGGAPGTAPSSKAASSVTPPRGAAIHWILFLTLACGITAADLWSKAWIFRLLGVQLAPEFHAQRHIEVIPGFFWIEANINIGAFSGWFAGQRVFLVTLSAAALVIIAWFFRTHLRGPGPCSLWFSAALGLLWGGTCGNLYDRALFGHVRDFIRWFIVWDGKERVWPNFNIADSAICVGVGIIIATFLFDSGRSAAAPPSGNARSGKA